MSRSAAEAAQELVEHVGPHGAVLEVVSRAEMRARGLRHRCTYVAVVNSSQELIVHQRAEWKDVYPGWWDVSFGGICDVGEDWLDAAQRELREEAGLETPVEYLGSSHYEGSDGRVLGRVYVARTDTEPTPVDGEVIDVGKVALADVDAWRRGRLVCHDSVQAVLPLLNIS